MRNEDNQTSTEPALKNRMSNYSPKEVINIFHSSSILQILCEFLDCFGPVADMVLNLHTQFSEGLVVAVRLEDRVVTKALPSPSLSDNLSFDNTLKLMDFLNTGAATRTNILLLY